jgi:hypothetical protein
MFSVRKKYSSHLGLINARVWINSGYLVETEAGICSYVRARVPARVRVNKNKSLFKPDISVVVFTDLRKRNGIFSPKQKDMEINAASVKRVIRIFEFQWFGWPSSITF